MISCCSSFIILKKTKQQHVFVIQLWHYVALQHQDQYSDHSQRRVFLGLLCSNAAPGVSLKNNRMTLSDYRIGN